MHGAQALLSFSSQVLAQAFSLWAFQGSKKGAALKSFDQLSPALPCLAFACLQGCARVWEEATWRYLHAIPHLSYIGTNIH